MIFVVVGTQEPFDRLIEHIDEWSMISGYNEIFAQVAKAKYHSKNIQSVNFLPPVEFDKKFQEAELIVGHAGMGTIISALQNSKPIVVMPRLSKYHEHRNNHQLATAISFEKLGLIKAVYSKQELFTTLNNRKSILPSKQIKDYASEMLTKTVRDFIHH